MSSSLVFVDTNVFAYALDGADARKQRRAQGLIDEHRREIVVSTQVLIELYAVCTRKLGMERGSAAAAVELISGFLVIATDRELVLRAVTLAADAQLSIFDAAIICATQRAGCPRILTEDLNAGQRLGDVLIENPFVVAAET